MEALFNTGKEIQYDGGTITVRRLGVIDVFKFAKLLSKVGTAAFAKIAVQMSAIKKVSEKEGISEEDKAKLQKESEAQAQQLGFTMFAQLLDYEDDLLGFLASLTNLDLETFKFIPPDVAIEVLTTIIQGEDMKRFFEKARALATTFNK